MPVGNSDRGIGLWAGQIMLSFDNQYEYIDWWHEAIPGSGENFAHQGDLFSTIFKPKITIGISNYWNITVSQTIGNRQMGWKGDTTTIHHRNEGTHTSFDNAIGGYLGDFKLIARYLAFNTGKGNGKRLYFGVGTIVPSNNTITSDPFFLNDEEMVPHRHFSLSDGVYKGVLETQYYIKQSVNPVFFGGSLSIKKPLIENKYGYKGSSSYNLILTGFSKLIKKINGSLGGNIILQNNSYSFWNGKKAPNSQSTILVLGTGALWNLSFGGLGVNIQKPLFLKGGFGGADKEDIEQKVNALQFSISYRKTLDWTIPWIDPLKNL